MYILFSVLKLLTDVVIELLSELLLCIVIFYFIDSKDVTALLLQLLMSLIISLSFHYYARI